MNEPARDWLPPGAASGDLLKAALQSAVEAWSAHWFAARTFHVGRLAERGAASESDGWLRRGRMTSVRSLKPSTTRLVEATLDLSLASVDLTGRDRRLVERFGELLIEDLCERIEARLEIDRSAAPAGEDHDWLEVSVAEGAGADLFWLALPLPALAGACRKAAGQAARLPALASLKTPLTDVSVQIEATLGQVEMSMPDLAALEPGDVLVLSTAIDEPIEISLLGSSQVFARARLADHNGELALAFQTRS